MGGLGDALSRVTGGLTGSTDEQDQIMDLMRKNQELYGNIKTPDLQWQEYLPELYQNESANYELVNEDPTLRSNQLSALERLKSLADQGLSDVDQASFFKARGQGNEMAKQRSDAVLEDAQRRGVSGGGLEFAMREMGNQGAAQRTQEAALQQAADSSRQRALYSQAYGQGLNQMRGQDQSVNAQNSDIINRFNQLNTNQRNQTNTANVDQKNNAFLTNQQGRQGVAQQNFNNQITKINGQTGVNNNSANAIGAIGAGKQAGINTLIKGGMMYATGGASAMADKKKEEGYLD